MNEQQRKRGMAKNLLVHFMKMASRGVELDDYVARKEIEAIVDDIIDAAVAEAIERIKAELALGGVYTGQ